MRVCFSSMTHAAIGELREAGFADVVRGEQLFAALQLVRRRLPFGVENLIARPEIFFRLAVALQAPAHVKRVRLPCDRHLIHRTVATRAADAFLDMDAVVEENEVRQVIDAFPVNGNARGEALAHRRQYRRVFPNLRVTGHAGFSGWQSGERGFFHGRVAVTAVEPEAADVMFVAEWRRLRERHVDFGGVGRPVNRVDHAPETEKEYEAPDQRRSREAIAALSENLGHNFDTKTIKSLEPKSDRPTGFENSTECLQRFHR